MDKFIKKITDLVAEVKTVINKEKEAKQKRRLIVILAVFIVVFVLFSLITAPIYTYESIYKDRIYPGVYIDGINISGLTKEQAIDKLNQHVDNLKTRGLNFKYKNQKLTVGLTVVSPEDPDLAFPILSFDNEVMVDQAYRIGRDKSLGLNLFNQLLALLNKKEIKLDYKLNEEELMNILDDRYKEMEEPAQNAQIVFKTNDQIEITQEKNGHEINYKKGLKQLKDNLNLISINTIEFEKIDSVAEVTKEEAESQRGLITEILKNDMLTLVSGEKKWEIKKDEFKNWLAFAKENSSMVLVFDQEKIQPKLDEIAQEIDVAPQNAKFVFANDKVTEFQPSKIGLELNKETSLIKINQEFFKNKITEIELNVDETKPQVKTADVNDMGITELLGKGVSDFAGSHTNRIKNIKNAVEHLNGTIIPPGEFSIVEAIGEVNAATGYYPEYVIKGDRTILEYGGGLCQIATTMYRSALYSGLPITERKPHSYIVSYYKPLGMDSTIYGPHPDLRFLNDTGNNILLQIHIEGTQLTFEFWGTSDGRQIEITEPVLYNWTGLPPDKLIENPNLKPGTKRLMESGRSGADAYFYRNIILANGEKIEETVRSHYVPWPNIYEIGVQSAPEPEPVEDGNDQAAPSGESGNTTNP